MSSLVEHWPMCQRCGTVCVKYLPRDGGGIVAWRQDCRCRNTHFARARGCNSAEPLVVQATESRWETWWGVPVTFLLILAIALVVLLVFRYQGLESQVQEACSETGAAAKLDLSSFVPVCLRVKQ